MLWGEQTMTLRDEIAAYIEQNASWSEYDILNEKALADGILALVRQRYYLGSQETRNSFAPEAERIVAFISALEGQ